MLKRFTSICAISGLTLGSFLVLSPLNAATVADCAEKPGMHVTRVVTYSDGTFSCYYSPN